MPDFSKEHLSAPAPLEYRSKRRSEKPTDQAKRAIAIAFAILFVLVAVWATCSGAIVAALVAAGGAIFLFFIQLEYV